MALDTVAVVEAGIEDVFDSLQLGQVQFGDATRGKNALMEVQAAFNSMYTPSHVITVTDATDADLATFLSASGEGAAIGIGQVFQLVGTGDTTDNAFAGLGGGGTLDKYQKTTAALAIYLGEDFTFSGEAESDW